MISFIKTMTWSRHLFLFYYFKKGKQNKKKKNPLKDGLWKKPDQARESGYLSRRYGKDRDTPLNP